MTFHSTPWAAMQGKIARTLTKDRVQRRSHITWKRGYRGPHDPEAYEEAVRTTKEIRASIPLKTRKAYAIVRSLKAEARDSKRKPLITLPKLNLPPIEDEE